jgi:hypothetical protein
MNDKVGNLIDRREMLRVKIKSLAEEARIIRKEELRTQGQLRAELHKHRVMDVRYEARVSHLAYGFIRGRTIEQMEGKGTRLTGWKRVAELCKKYGPAGFVLPEVVKV